MKTPYRALDLPPRLTNKEWVWFFEYVTKYATSELRETVAAEAQLGMEIAILGRPIPYMGTMDIDPIEKRASLAENRASYQRIIDMAVYLLRQAQNAGAGEFGNQMAAYFNNQQKGTK